MRHALCALLALTATLATAAGTDLARLGGQLTGTDAFKKTQTTRSASGKLKKKVVAKGKDDVRPTIFFLGIAGATTGMLEITGYEDFPVTGTWTLAANGTVTLAVDAAAFAAARGAELCPGDTCTPTATWTPKRSKFVARKQTLKAKWLVTLVQTYADGSSVRETFAFRGAGTLSPLS